MRWLFTVFLFAKNHRTAVPPRHGRRGSAVTATAIRARSLGEKEDLMYLQNRYLEPSCSFINLIEQTDF